MKSLSLSLRKYSKDFPLLEQEKMSRHCSLKLGGPADFFAQPQSVEELQIVMDCCRQGGIAPTILGGGANILVADRGIRGLVIHTGGIQRVERQGNNLLVEAGCDVSDASERALSEGLEGLEWIYRMPGSMGGAVWMNARCYGSEIAEILEWVEVLNHEGYISRLPFNAAEWAYKKSPFQQSRDIILRVCLRLKEGDKSILENKMEEIGKDRIQKGHFKKPSAGSTFKNNRQFGAPSGVIIEQCGLKGTSIGGAAVSDWHANILINRGGTSRDFRNLIERVQEEVHKMTGFLLEREVLYIGDWRKE